MPIRVRVELDADTQRLSDTIQRAVSKGFQGGGSQGLATNPQSIARQIAGTSGQGMKGYRDTMGAYSLPPTPEFFSNPRFFFSKILPPTIASVQAKNQAQQAAFLKNIGFAGIPLLSPGSVLGNLFATRQIFSGLSGPVGQKLLGGVGLAGTGGTVAATATIMPILLAFGAALKGLQIAIRQTAAAYDDARKLYAHSLLSGLGLQFTANRQNLADVLGVSEKEVFQFGAAVAFIGPKLKFASDVMARTAPNLTSVSYEFEILKKNLGAMFAVLANDAAPALRKFVDGLNVLIESLTRFFEKNKIGIALEAIFEGMIGSKVADIIASKGKDIGPAPTPQGFMKQLPASALERMGLVVGGFGGGGDSAQRTAKATEKSAKLLEVLVRGASAARGAASFYDPLASNP